MTCSLPLWVSCLPSCRAHASSPSRSPGTAPVRRTGQHVLTDKACPTLLALLAMGPPPSPSVDGALLQRLPAPGPNCTMLPMGPPLPSSDGAPLHASRCPGLAYLASASQGRYRYWSLTTLPRSPSRMTLTRCLALGRSLPAVPMPPARRPRHCPRGRTDRTLARAGPVGHWRVPTGQACPTLLAP